MTNPTQARFVDIHTHILPGVDDGAKDLDEACELIRMAWENGTGALFLTPHYRGVFRKHTPAMLRDTFETLRQRVKTELPEMKLYLGTEIHYEFDAPEKLAEDRILTMNDSRYVLLEYSSNTYRSQILNGASEMLRYGYIPIIAHAERYDFLRKNRGIVDSLLEMGALIQFNADSVMGERGFAVKRFCDALLKKKKVHFIASDAHDSVQRPPLLRACWERVSKKYGAEYADQLFRRNATLILEDE